MCRQHCVLPVLNNNRWVKFDVQNITFTKVIYFNIPENDLKGHRRHCCHFLCKETVVTIATVANDVGSQQWQCWGQATVVETEAVVGVHNNQPTNGSDMVAEIAFAAAAAATAAAMAAAVATAAMAAMVAMVAMAAMAAMAAAQTVAAAMVSREIYINKGRKRTEVMAEMAATAATLAEAVAAAAAMAAAATAATAAVAASAATVE
jgi:hypothetical protein